MVEQPIQSIQTSYWRRENAQSTLQLIKPNWFPLP